jgi:universal stress protein A
MPSPWQTILVPTDFSECSDAALTLAGRLAGIHEAKLVLLHASELTGGIEPSMIVHPDGESRPVTAERFLRTSAEEKLRAQAARCLGDVPVHLRVELGRPDESILRVAHGVGADVIVMGTHGRSGLAHLLVGSVAERVVRASPIAVVTVRRPDATPHDSRTNAERDLEDETAG